MHQVQFEFGVIPTIINKNRNAEYIEALVATREQENIETIISEYKESLENDDIDNVPANVPVNLTGREIEIVGLKERNILVRVGAAKNGKWQVN